MKYLVSVIRPLLSAGNKIYFQTHRNLQSWRDYVNLPKCLHFDAIVMSEILDDHFQSFLALIVVSSRCNQRILRDL